jgi:hypothetical protein
MPSNGGQNAGQILQVEGRVLAFDGNRDGRLDLDEFTRAAARFIRARQEVTGEPVTRWSNAGQTLVIRFGSASSPPPPARHGQPLYCALVMIHWR